MTLLNLAKKPQDAMRDWSWRDWLHGEILCREAEALLEPDQNPGPALRGEGA